MYVKRRMAVNQLNSASLKRVAEREVSRMSEIIPLVKLKKEEDVGKGAMEVFEMAKGYLEDSRYFLEKGLYLEAFEAAVICWAYLDSLLRLGFIEIPEDYRELFTS
ncbi:hypothetical protein DRN46_04735 [Thermococci archaeon]|nr:MAG: hypothetical protein DRN46_04735 [Thermococci archaeon]